jgi:hypothetical protein
VTGEAIDVQAHAGDAVAEEPMPLVQLLIVRIFHRLWPIDEGSRNNGEQPGEALAGFRMRPVDLIIECLYGGTIRDEAGVKENAGIVIRKILLLKALVDLLVQLMLVHGGKIEENRFRAIGGEFSSTALAEEQVSGDSAGAAAGSQATVIRGFVELG